jgi:hypothetical protein
MNPFDLFAGEIRGYRKPYRKPHPAPAGRQPVRLYLLMRIMEPLSSE